MGLSLSERDKKVIWHPYTPQKYAPDPIPIVKGERAWLIDDKGNRYLDAISSWWVTIHGHSHPYIAEKVFEQAKKLEQVIFAGFTHEPAVELAERLLGILPGNFSKIFYSDNGSTSTEVAIKMAIQYWRNKGIEHKTRVLALTNAYHGDTFGAMSVSERGVFTLSFGDMLFDVLFADIPGENDSINVKGYSKDESKKLLKECACVIYEPLLQGAGGMVMHGPAALDNFIAQCKSHEIICIADEVLTGFGRTGKMFASSHCQNVPDIICLSKGLTGGTMALGVTACTQKIHDAFVDDDKSKTFYHGHSFTANPLACSAAIASLDLFEIETTLDNVQRIVERNKDFVGRLNQVNHIENTRQCGTIVAFELKDVAAGYNSNIKDVITVRGLKKGVYLRPLGNTVYIMPPYCITDDELDVVHDAIVDIIEQGFK